LWQSYSGSLKCPVFLVECGDSAVSQSVSQSVSPS